ncbi:MAG: 1-(5-phosphoribosyl)-5-[(5-phosphoribosylamino)methylideneamino]imidazole-4-carboxamide isomerase [Xanthomonadales bacterium]|nr:1-(5-phosphoribosyl)-5-[(5-phosphoribosylamino)methylideneamino]imidazole-4-carboxamide isomerase [Xanthomonadales bacterium]
MMILYPAIDLRDGRCVRLLRGDYDRETRYREDPAALAEEYRSAGANWIHVVDLDGARSGNFANLEAIEAIAKTGATIQCGGGIRAREDVKRLLDSGVSRVVIGSLAVAEPDRVGDWIDDFGSAAICLALDVRRSEEGGEELAAAGWTESTGVSLAAGIASFQGHALEHVLCTDIGRDGTLEGPATSLYRKMAARWPALSIQASGGVRALSDLDELRGTGVSGVVVGRAILEGRFTVEEALQCLRDG